MKLFRCDKTLNSIDKIKIKAPGRICLFGEHQDYLGLPVISAAISLYITIEAIPNNEDRFKLEFLDLDKRENIVLDESELGYRNKRDYIKSAYNIFLRNGFSFRQGYDCQIYGDIPINAGAASSSALTVAWTAFLASVTKPKVSLEKIAEIAHTAEVLEFSESGGNMDHITSTYGKLLYIETKAPISIEKLKARIEGIVLGDSLIKKTTVEDLLKVKSLVTEGLSYLKQNIPNFNLNSTKLKEIEKYLDNSDISKKIYANIINRDLTKQAKIMLRKDSFDKKELGNLLNEHQTQLNENLGISIKKINSMVDAALAAGALGCKINGSGFGGTMFAYAPGYKREVADAIKNCGGKSYIIKIVEGVNYI